MPVGKDKLQAWSIEGGEDSSLLIGTDVNWLLAKKQHGLLILFGSDKMSMYNFCIDSIWTVAQTATFEVYCCRLASSEIATQNNAPALQWVVYWVPSERNTRKKWHRQLMDQCPMGPRTQLQCHNQADSWSLKNRETEDQFWLKLWTWTSSPPKNRRLMDGCRK